MSLFACPCGCDLKLSSKDAADLRWLDELSGNRPDNPAPINLKVQRASFDGRYGADEPMTTLECGRCGSDVEAATYIAEFLERWGMGSPDCARCHAKRKAA